MNAARWFLLPQDRGNPATRLDSRHPGFVAWSEGNLVRPLVHGARYFAELARRLAEMRAGDLVMFADWRGDPDERLTGEPGSEVGTVFAEAAGRGVDVRGLMWRSHLDRFAFSSEENRHSARTSTQRAASACWTCGSARGGSHHQKFVVLRHPGRPERDIAFVARHGPLPQPA